MDGRVDQVGSASGFHAYRSDLGTLLRALPSLQPARSPVLPPARPSHPLSASRAFADVELAELF